MPRRVESAEGTTAELVDAVNDGRLHVALTFQDAAAPRREHPGLRRHDVLDEPLESMDARTRALIDRGR